MVRIILTQKLQRSIISTVFRSFWKWCWWSVGRTFSNNAGPTSQRHLVAEKRTQSESNPKWPSQIGTGSSRRGEERYLPWIRCIYWSGQKELANRNEFSIWSFSCSDGKLFKECHMSSKSSLLPSSLDLAQEVMTMKTTVQLEHVILRRSKRKDWLWSEAWSKYHSRDLGFSVKKMHLLPRRNEGWNSWHLLFYKKLKVPVNILFLSQLLKEFRDQAAALENGHSWTNDPTQTKWLSKSRIKFTWLQKRMRRMSSSWEDGKSFTSIS